VGWWQKLRRSGAEEDLPEEAPAVGVESPTAAERPAPHSADGPIDDPADDLLAREPFALALAEDVRLAPRGSGFIIGLTGVWGGGKTSVLQLVARALEDDVGAVVEFNPWLFSGTEQLVSYLFSELAGQLEETGDEKLAKVAGALTSYGTLVSPLRYVPWVGSVIKATGDVAGGLGNLLDPDEPSVRERARQLREQLSGLEQPILVLVDDLDRLGQEEIVDVVRLVRLVGDFPNLVYLLAFDPEVVEEALTSERGGDGHAYLEKIIHVSHALPPIRHEDLTTVLQSALEQALPDLDDYRLDSERLDSLFWGEARALFATVRDVRRFVNLLRTTLDLLGDEVDLADVLTLEALRLFEPTAFAAIVAARYPLTGATSPLGRGAFAGLLGPVDDSAERRQIDGILEACPAEDRERLGRIVRALFPHAERYLSEGLAGADLGSGLAAARRVGAAEVFDTYLHRRLAPSALPSREVEQVVGLLGDRRSLQEHLDGLDDDRVRGLYKRLAEHAASFPPEACAPAMEAVMHRGVGFGDTFTDMSGSQLLRRLLAAAPSERLAAILGGLDYPNLSRRYELVRAVAYRGETGREMIPRGEVDALKEELLDAMLAASAAELVDEPDLAPLIGLAARHRKEKLRDRLEEWLPDDDFLVDFVTAHMMSKVGGGGHRSVQLNWRSLTALVPLETLRDRLEEVDPDWVEREFDADRWILWQQALRYVDFPADADEDLRGWPIADGPEAADEDT
jgi:hypothetical protein